MTRHMKLHKSSSMVAAVMLALLFLAGTVHAEPPAAQRAFDRLATLVGDWVSADEPAAKQLHLSYRLISSGSALVETYTTPTGKETLTIYHLDGTRLLATHYCAQGNQPRLRLTSKPDASSLVFDFVDATNLASPRASHLNHVEIALTDTDHLTKSETYRENGKDDTIPLHLTRVRREDRK